MNRTLRRVCAAASVLALGATALALPQDPPASPSIPAKVQELYQWAGQNRADAQNMDNVRAKIEELFGSIDFGTASLEDVQQVAGFAHLVPSLQEKVNARIEALAAEPGPDGAAAAASAIGPALNAGDEAKIVAAYRRAVEHPALAEAVAAGKAGEVFGLVGYLPDAALVELKDSILGLASHFEGEVPMELAMTGVEYVVAINKLSDHIDAETRAKIHASVVAAIDRAGAALSEEQKAMGMGEQIENSKAYLNGAYARGELIGHEAPAINFAWWSGQNAVASLAELKGKVVVLDFWATWCGPCIASFPNVRELQQRYEGYEVAVVGVTSLQGMHYPGDGPPVSTEGDPAKEQSLMAEFMKAKDMTWLVGFGDKDVFNPDFGVRGIPHVAIIDAEGKVRYNGLHPAATSLKEKAEKIDGLLKEAGLPTPGPVVEDEAAAGEGDDGGGV